ncbi:glycosyltransferase family 87 protein [Microlunatus sp. Y2014]|uniref:glycosyltransferase family 87 protein n=1 Tax=Microlunatus sp. Y2014 TaxID=3418488 RepID=UPI003DA70C4D
MTLPSWTDPIVRMASEAIGGPRGDRGTAPRRIVVVGVVIVVATLTWLANLLQKVPCRLKVDETVDWFAKLCYSDIPLLYRYRGLADGNTPLLDQGNYQVLEYPVLTGGLLEVQRWITVALGAPVGPGLTEAEAVRAQLMFFDVNSVVLFVLFLVAVLAQVHTPTGRPWDALMVAASPAVILTGLINWDMWPMALTALGCLFWARRMPVLAGVLLGLACAAKLYPLLLLGPLFLLCLRAARMEAFARTVSAFLVSWAAVNLPVMLLAPQQWMVFWTFNSDRDGELGSIWYVYELITGNEFPALNTVNALLLILGCAAIGVLIMVAPRRPRFGQVAYLVVFVFLVLNKVYSPQYVLWLLPLMVLARPRWRDWIVFTTGEVVYTVAIWAHLGGFSYAGAGGDRIYWLAVFFRIGCEAWVAAQVVLDILHPERDPVRLGRDPSGRPVDDPTGGLLDHAPDADWFRRLWNRYALGSGGARAAGEPAAGGAGGHAPPA